MNRGVVVVYGTKEGTQPLRGFVMYEGAQVLLNRRVQNFSFSVGLWVIERTHAKQ